MDLNSIKQVYCTVLSNFLETKATDLKKGFFGKPNPYIKINVFPRVRHAAAAQKHHGLQGKSSSKQNIAEPVWEGEVHNVCLYSSN